MLGVVVAPSESAAVTLTVARLCIGSLVLAAALSLQANTAVPNTHVVIVTGIGGESYYDELFARWSSTLRKVAIERLNVAEQNLVHLAPGGHGAHGESLKKVVLETLEATMHRSSAGDVIAIVLIGHGSAQGARVRFNLPGPDLSPHELATALDAITDRTVVIVNTSPASGPFVPLLSARDRIIITATSSGAENQHTRFGGYFVEAFAQTAADSNKDQRVSLLEAFNYARREVAQSFKRDARLQTEHAMLDDNGDGEGSSEPELNDSDGTNAARVHLAAARSRGDEARAQRGVALSVAAARVVDQIEALKRLKPSLEEDDYRQRLEILLIELALNRRAMKAHQ